MFSVNADDCNILNNCHRHGECVPSRLYPNEFECRCNPGFFGDGYRCHNASSMFLVSYSHNTYLNLYLF